MGWFERLGVGALFSIGACVVPQTPMITGGSTGMAEEDDDNDASTSTTTGQASEDSTTGLGSFCGDGIVDEGEECDLGPDNSPTGACLPDCVNASCGDGNVQDGVEDCDDGNEDETDACTTACELPRCGDGFVQMGEECDNGGDNGDRRECKSDCTDAFCGDGHTLDGVEDCDDANTDNNDGCNENCGFTDCGDGFWNPEIGEVCDDGIGSDGDECNDDCLTWGLWDDTYNGTGSSNDWIFGIDFDSNGDIVVAGSTYVTGDSDDVWVRKYDPTGDEVWTETYHGITSDIGYAVAVGSNDDIFVAGSTFTLTDNRDIWLRRYASDGTAGFTRTFNGTADEADEAHGVAVDGNDNIIVVGYAEDGQGRDIWVRKYNSAGSTTWTRSVGGAAGEDDEGHAVAVDGGNNVIVVGHISSNSNGDNIWVRKYNGGGTEQWTDTYNGAGNGNDVAFGVAIDSGNNIVVTGFETTGSSEDIWIRKYDSNGNELWTDTFNGDEDDLDRGRAVAIDANDDILVAGSTFVADQSDNIWMRRYDADGDVLWTVTYNSPGWQSDVAHAVSIDDMGNMAVGGFVTRSELGESRNSWLRYVLPD